MAHSQAMWSQPWHLKHWRKLGSFLFEVASLDPCVFGPWPPVVVVPVPCLTDALWTEVVCPRPVWPLWELGQPGLFLSICSLPQPLCLGLFGALVGWLPCSSLVRAAINLAIWFPNSFSALYRFCGHDWPSPYLVMGFFIFTLCLASSDHQLGIGGPGIAIVISYWISNMFADPLEETICEMPSHLLICYPPVGTASWFDWGSLPALWQRREPSCGYPG